ncbi:MAG: hypothetical protein OEV49_17445 [candidate division Zixibacteria bacterium]|nr:hypothetical protein [candidate division Zixibacteria bacterium]MDH3938566.1 hypothetical protein [candidate division Zixibacteria bacterium]MDH4034748.1 hypothetical protein [candidate division Zixibacteria bacterium]
MQIETAGALNGVCAFYNLIDILTTRVTLSAMQDRATLPESVLN